MHIDFSVENFRAFRDRISTNVRPITILVGENSAGKTSYLAGLRYLIEAFGSSAIPSFNKEPFFLGAYDQIAHYRGGSAGRARSFLLGASGTLDQRRGQRKRPATSFSIEFVLTKKDLQAKIEKYTFSADKTKIIVDVESSTPSVKLVYSNEEVHELDQIDSFTGIFKRSKLNTRFLMFVIHDIYYTSKQKSSGNSLAEQRIAELIDPLFECMEEASMDFSRALRAFSPVRSQPERTYNAVDVEPGSEGSHVPFEMAKLSRTNARDWARIKKNLEEFGTRSGLFQEIRIRDLGKTGSDPFQLQFKVNGPFFNIIDIGYGVSQVLPFLFESFVNSGSGIFLVQQPEVHLHPKAQAEIGTLICKSVADNRRKCFVVETHSDFLIDRVRLAVREKIVRRQDVTILHFSREKIGSSISRLELNELGEIVSTPPGYRDFFLGEELNMLSIR